MFGLISFLLSVGWAESPQNLNPEDISVDYRIERLQRLERALQIEDCEYALQELEYLNVDYSQVPFRYALFAEAYLCVGQPEKAKLAIQEFARLKGEANRLSLRVQQFCAINECAIQPTLVPKVQRETVEVIEVASSIAARSENSVPTSEKSISSVTPILNNVLLLSPQEIYALMDVGKFDEAILEAQKLVLVEQRNALAWLTLGDALANYPQGTGDVYAAFDAWMRAKDFYDPKSKMWKVAKERLAWSLERSGIVKLIPTRGGIPVDFPEGFTYTIQAAAQLDWTLRTDRMKGGIYLTNMPVGDFELRWKASPDGVDMVNRHEIEKGEFFKMYLELDVAEKTQKSPVQSNPGVSKGVPTQNILSQDEVVEERLVPSQTVPEYSIPLDEVRLNIAEMEYEFQRPPRWMVPVMMGTTAYSLFSAKQGLHYIDLANAEVQSQEDFDRYSKLATVWNVQYTAGLLTTIPMLVWYIQQSVQYSLHHPTSVLPPIDFLQNGPTIETEAVQPHIIPVEQEKNSQKPTTQGEEK